MIKNKNALRLLILLLFPLIILSSCTKTKIEYWENGNKKSELLYFNGKLDGISTWWYESGEKQMECTYKNNMLEGQSTRWYFNGNKQRLDFYKNNMLNDTCITWHENGTKKSVTIYINDTLNGTVTEWHDDGHIKVNGTYKNGLYEGKWEYWDKNGIKVGEGEYKNGTGIQKGFSPDGKLMREINYINNKKNGFEIWYNKNGNMIKRITFDNDHIAYSEDSLSLSKNIN
ncbi:MAG TPA: toxin-antitoxin system YwqK family antitoxin [Bacteroidales bacterium]|nr:toxin-antitoxin system YwqK family antitoxin [Bacteroidales bacterium]HPS17954.1 toxin-antitoxin system YwqK family antitoxin [Bacteroidales bacterium]